MADVVDDLLCQKVSSLHSAMRIGTDNGCSRSFVLSEGELSRIQKSVMDYWKRTYLLFGLIA